MTTSRQAPPAAVARDDPPTTLADLDARAAELLAHSRALRAQSHQLLVEGKHLRRSSAVLCAALKREPRVGLASPGSQAGSSREH